MSELIENTKILVEKFNDSIRTDLSTKKIDTKGIASNSLRVESDLNSVRSLGIFYLEYLDRGRPPGKFPPVDVIREWVNSKPVEINPYLVGRKIAREGTEIFKNPSKGIMLNTKIRKLMEEINQKAPLWAKQDLLIQIRKGNQNIK